MDRAHQGSIMTLRPFPTTSLMRWRRLDVPGREEARADRTATGWRLSGELDVEEAGVAARLRYGIDCDPEWRTRSALIEGDVGGGTVRFSLTASGTGHWMRDGVLVPELAGALDVDLGFTPATNTLPIRRLALAVGESASRAKCVASLSRVSARAAGTDVYAGERADLSVSSADRQRTVRRAPGHRRIRTRASLRRPVGGRIHGPGVKGTTEDAKPARSLPQQSSRFDGSTDLRGNRLRFHRRCHGIW